MNFLSTREMPQAKQNESIISIMVNAEVFGRAPKQYALHIQDQKNQEQSIQHCTVEWEKEGKNKTK